MVHDHGLVPEELPLPETGGEFLLPGGPVGGADALDAFFHGLGPPVGLVHSLEGPHAEIFRRLFQLGDLGLLLLVLLQTLLIPPLLLLHIEGVVAGVELRLAVVDLRHPFDHLVQKPAVVGDGQHRALEVLQVALQPLGGVQVQVVGGLVQQEDVRILQNEPGQVDAGLLPAGQGGEGPLAHVGVDGQAVAHLVQPGLGVIAAPRLKGGGQLVIAGEHLRRGALPHPGGQGLHLPLHGVERRKGGVQHVPDGVPLRIHRDLGDESQPLARGDGHRPLIRLHLPGENAEEGGLAGAVLAQQSHPLPLVHLEREAI